MPATLTDIFFALLRLSLCADATPIASPLSEEEWKQIFALSKKQSLLGVIYSGIQRLPENLQPPSDLMDRWSQVMLKIMATNSLMNGTAAKLTQMFGEQKRKTVILKGQANALLYPDPYVRQAGDIDILVEGGRSSVLKLLEEMNLLHGEDFFELSNLHAHIDSGEFPGLQKGVSVEVHFIPSYNYSPFTTRAMCDFLARETSKPGAVKLSSEGFYVPPFTFALTMQLSHLQRHFIEGGVGLRQLADYSLLLRNSSQADRDLVSHNLRKMGLYHMAGAVMYVMRQIFLVSEDQLLCATDIRRGQQLLDKVLEGGNFGKFSPVYNAPMARHWFLSRFNVVKMFSFDVSEAFWAQARYVLRFTTSIPFRIKVRKLSLRKV